MVSMRQAWGVFIACAAMLLISGGAVAQRGGGLGSPVPVGRTPPSGIDEKDDLQGFHRAMALQATSQQTADFRALVKKTEAVARSLDELVKGLGVPSSGKSVPEQIADVRQAIETARTETESFVAGFSPAQKAGLKEITARLTRAESELGEQEKMLEAGGDAQAEASRIVARADELRKALANLRSAQDSLAMDMGIVTSESEDEVAFTIPARKSSATIAGQAVGITTRAVLTRAHGGSGGENVYNVEATTDLAELQANIGAILASTMNKDDRCGERVRVQEASITPDVPSAMAIARLHYERWVCSPVYGTREMTEGNATITMKLLPEIGSNGEVLVSAEILDVEAERFFVDLVKSGTLGPQLRENMAEAVTAASPNLKSVLPAAGGKAMTRVVRFESPREGELNLVVGGELHMSGEQAKAFGEQLKERAAK